MQIWILMPVKKFICGNSHVSAKLVTFGPCEPSWVLASLILEIILYNFWEIDFLNIQHLLSSVSLLVGLVGCFPMTSTYLQKFLVHLHILLFLKSVLWHTAGAITSYRLSWARYVWYWPTSVCLCLEEVIIIETSVMLQVAFGMGINKPDGQNQMSFCLINTSLHSYISHCMKPENIGN